MLIGLALNSSYQHCSAWRGNHSVANRMLVAVQAIEKWDVSCVGFEPLLRRDDQDE